MKSINHRRIVLLIVILLLATIANAQSYTTKFTAVRSGDKQQLFEENTLFVYSDSTFEVFSPHVTQTFKLSGMVHSTLFTLIDEKGDCAYIEYFFYRKRRFLKKDVVQKFISLTYDKEYLFYFEKP